MSFLLYIAIGYLIFTTVILLRNKQHFTPLSMAEEAQFSKDSPKVSICIPARNEEQVIERCIRSALRQNYPNFEVIVLNDNSTDATDEKLSSLKQNNPNADRLLVIQGKPKPDEWLGKSWACQQLAEAADGDILIFADADTWFEKRTVARVVRTMGQDIVDMLTVWPLQVLDTFWEKMIIPLVYYALLSLLPVHYVYRSPRWMPKFIRKQFSPMFAAACGQFMAFKAHAYHQIGGHQSVKDKVVEDVQLAKKIKEAGFSMRMYYGSQSIACRMYHSEKEIRAGFRKNFLAGFRYNMPLFILMGLLHFITFILPVIILVFALITWNIPLLWLSGVAVSLMLLHRFLLARWFGWSMLMGLLHPVSVAWFQVLALIVVNDHLADRTTNWKGRPI